MFQLCDFIIIDLIGSSACLRQEPHMVIAYLVGSLGCDATYMHMLMPHWYSATRFPLL
jgi:hypothetical protein